MTTKTAKTLTAFALYDVMYKGAEPEFRFAFQAESEEAAKDKAFKWARYQGFDSRDITVRVATEEQTPYIRNEYMAHLR